MLLHIYNFLWLPNVHKYLISISNQFSLSTFRMNNFTHVVLNRTLSPLDMMDTGPAFVGICCFFTFIVEIFGNGNLLIMMVYERFGMDPQKRTVNNQLIFNLCVSNIIQNLISCPLLTYRMLVSPLGKLSFL